MAKLEISEKDLRNALKMGFALRYHDSETDELLAEVKNENGYYFSEYENGTLKQRSLCRRLSGVLSKVNALAPLEDWIIEDFWNEDDVEEELPDWVGKWQTPFDDLKPLVDELNNLENDK